MLNLKDLITVIFEDHLGVFEEGVSAITSCLTQMSVRVTLIKGSKVIKRLLD